MRKQILPPDAAIVDAQGKPTTDFYEILQNVLQNLPTMPVAETAPTDGQILKFVSATGLYTPSADNT